MTVCKANKINGMKFRKFSLFPILALTIVFFTSCAKTGDNNTNNVTSDMQQQQNKEDFVPNSGFSASPWVDSDLKENITEDMKLSAKEDFHMYANYAWLKDTEIPEGDCSWSFFDEVAKQVKDKEFTLIEDETLDSHEAELVQDFYQAILDWDERNSRGLSPMIQVIEDIQNVKSLEEMTDLICDSDKGRFLSKFINISIEPAISDSSKYIVALRINEHLSPEGQKKMGFPYQETAEKTYVANMLELCGYNRMEAAQMYEAAVMSVEPYMLWNPQSRENADSVDYYEKNNVIISKDDIRNLNNVFPLMRILESYGVTDAEQYQVFCPELFKNLDQIYIDGNLNDLKKYLTVSCVMNMASLLNQDAENVFYNYLKSLYGMNGVRSDKDSALKMIEKYLNEPLGRAYLQKYDMSETKQSITDLVEQIINEYRGMLKEEDWLSETTKKYAIEKLDSISINVIYPDVWEDYSELDLKGLSYFDAVIKILDFQWQKDLAKIGGVDKQDKWRSSVFDTNAYYDPLYNSINICCGITDGELYYDGISKEELYAGLGTIIGHEISHAFDTKGALYDKNGDFVNWWTAEDYETFQNKSEKLIKYYNNMTAWSNGFVNGKLVCGEAISDMAGMKVILKLAEKIQDFDYEKFFVSYAKLWRRISSKKYEEYLLAGDAHLLNYLRTNSVLQQFDIFLNTFDIKEGDNMFLASNKRVSIW